MSDALQIINANLCLSFKRAINTENDQNERPTNVAISTESNIGDDIKNTNKKASIKSLKEHVFLSEQFLRIYTLFAILPIEVNQTQIEGCA